MIQAVTELHPRSLEVTSHAFKKGKLNHPKKRAPAELPGESLDSSPH